MQTYCYPQWMINQARLRAAENRRESENFLRHSIYAMDQFAKQAVRDERLATLMEETNARGGIPIKGETLVPMSC
jgi:hypothetical protein